MHALSYGSAFSLNKNMDCIVPSMITRYNIIHWKCSFEALFSTKPKADKKVQMEGYTN